MRIQHPAQATKGWPAETEDDRQTGKLLAETIERIRWRLWHGHARRSLDLIEETAAKLEATTEDMASVAAAQKVARLLRDLEAYVSGQSEVIIDYAEARRCDEPISTAITESTVQWLLHRRMSAQQQMRWSPRGAHLMLKVRTAAVNGTLDRDYAVAERWARRPFRRRPEYPQVLDGLVSGPPILFVGGIRPVLSVRRSRPRSKFATEPQMLLRAGRAIT
jgi:hypothetical protein